MVVVSYVSPRLLGHVMEVVQQTGAEHRPAANWGAIAPLAAAQQVTVLIVDPWADGTDRTRDVAGLMQSFPASASMTYTEFSPRALRATGQLARHGIHEPMLHRLDDGESRFRRTLIRLATASMTHHLFATLGDAREQFPPELWRVVDALFARPRAYGSARDLVSASGIPLTSMYRAFYLAGLEPPKRLCVTAHLLHAINLLRNPEYTVPDVAERLGYGHARILREHTVAAFGLPPNRLRRHVDSDLLLDRLKWWVRRH